MPAKLTIQDAHNLANSRGFKFLSLEFKNTSTKDLWECSKGHEWYVSYNSIRNGRGCPHCAGKCPKTIQDAHNIAELKGGKCLSKKFEYARSKYLWECKKGHQWEATYSDVKSKTWCPHCCHNVKKNLDYCQKVAELKGGKCLSTNYKDVFTKMEWECNSGHNWYAHLHSVEKLSWCPYCAGMAKNNLQFFQKLARMRGGKCLSTKYQNALSKINWECEKGHIWSAKPNQIQQGQWCPECAGTKKKTLENCHQLAELHNGKCLSIEYKNANEIMDWQCHKGHTWKTTYASINGGRWCPECSDKTKGEKLTRYCFEKIFQCDFKKIKPEWMRNPKTNLKLELDGYNQQMGIAFEHQGEQHEKDCRKSNKFYDPEILIRDEIKRQKCKERGITLIEVPEIGRRLKLKDVVPFLLSEFDKHNIAYPESAKSFQIDIKEFYAEYMNEKSTTGVDDLLSELDAMDFSDDSLFVDSIMDEVNNLDFDDPDLFN